MDNKLFYRVIENFCHFNDLDIYHERMKSLILFQSNPNTDTERYAVYLSDTLSFVLNHLHDDFNCYLLKRIYFLIANQAIDDKYIQEIVKTYYLYQDNNPFELCAIIFHLIMHLEIEHNLELGFMLANLVLLKNNLGPILLSDNLKEPFEYATKCEDYLVLLQFLKNVSFKNKNNFKSSKEISLDEVIKLLVSNKNTLKNKYHVAHLLLYGSIVRKNNNKNSDVDMLVNFKNDIIFKAQVTLTKELKDYLSELLKTNVDIINIEYAIASFKNMRLNDAIKIY